MTGKILVVANEPMLSTVASVLADCWKYSVLRTNDVRRALRGAVVWQPHVVVVEGLELDGGWLCEELKKLRLTQNIPVIIMSHRAEALSDVAVWQYFVSHYGADEYLSKPLRLDQLVQMVMWCQWQAKYSY